MKLEHLLIFSFSLVLVDGCFPTVPVVVPEISTTSSTTTTTTTTTEAPPSCPDGWTLFDRTPTPWCMRVALGATTQSTALATCQALDPSAVISGFQNQNEITTMTNAAIAAGSGPTNLIIGAKRTTACEGQVLTATCTTTTSFEWTDGSTTGTDGFQWLAGQPDNSNGVQNFVVILVASGLMDDADGTGTRGGVVCGMNAT